MTTARPPPQPYRAPAPRGDPMPRRTAAESEPTTPNRHRCRCGHFPTDHMVVTPVGASGNFRLDPSGPCTICGEGVCRKFTAGGG